jgi:hypothetical protein
LLETVVVDIVRSVMALPAASSRPLMLVDIDGVLNCFGDLGRSLVSFEQEFVAAGRYRIKVPAGATAALHRFAEVFECVWATTWEHDAQPEIGDRLGISPGWPHITFDYRDDQPTPKLASVQEFVGDRPAAWLDDEIGPDARQWAAERDASGIPTLLLQTRCDIGLGGRQITRALEWAAALRS